MAVHADRVDWDIDPAGVRFLKALNAGEKGYNGGPVSEDLMERVIDSFEKSVKNEQLPPLALWRCRRRRISSGGCEPPLAL